MLKIDVDKTGYCIMHWFESQKSRVLIMLLSLSYSFFPCVDYVCPPVVVQPWFLLACPWVGLTLSLVDYEDLPPPRFKSWSQVPAEISLVLCQLWSYLGGTLVVWRQPLDVLVPWLWGGNLVQVNVSCCLWLALGYLLEAIKVSTVSSCLCWASVYMGGSKLWTVAICHQYWAWSRSAKVQGMLRSARPEQTLFLPQVKPELFWNTPIIGRIQEVVQIFH